MMLQEHIEDLEDQVVLEMDRRMYLPDNLYWFKRHDYGHSLLEKRSTYFLTDDDYNVLKRAILNLDSLDQDLIKKPLAVTVVDEASSNVDYRLERTLKCLNCCKPFRKAELKVQSENGIDLFTMAETKRNKTFQISSIADQTIRVDRDPGNNKLFSVLDQNSARLGTIEKSWEPLFGMPTMDGHYHIKFNENAADLNDEIKYIVLLSVFVLDFLFHVPVRRQDVREEYKDFQGQASTRNNSSVCDTLSCCFMCFAFNSALQG